MTATDLQSMFDDMGNITEIDGKGFVAATDDWWVKEFCPWWMEFIKHWGWDKWADQWLCKDFAAMFRVFAQRAHASTHKVPDERLICAEFWYRRDDGTGHALNFMLTDKGPVYIEPQTGKRVTLSTTEIASCYKRRFS